MLPYFHAETDTGVRGDFIASVRTVIQRLRGAISQLHRALQRQAYQNRPKTVKSSELCSKQEVSEVTSPSEYVLDQHMAFLNWYIRFLVSELQPTASYQRHITALKILTTVLQSGLDVSVPQGYLSRDAQGDVKWSVNIPILQPLLHRMLFDLSMDPFDDVREAAVPLIKMSGPAARRDRQQWPRIHPLSNVKGLTTTNGSRSGQAAESFCQDQQDGLADLMIVLFRAQKTLHGTGRADHADGVARLYEILNEACVGRISEASPETPSGNDWCSSTFGIVDRILTALEGGLLLAKTNLRLAVASAPIHGHLAALRYYNLDTDSPVSMTFRNIDLTFSRYIIAGSRPSKGIGMGASGWKVLHRRMLDCCDNVWDSVRDVLCIDSPEGHTAEETDDLDIGEKDTLSYSWRALKEAR